MGSAAAAVVPVAALVVAWAVLAEALVADQEARAEPEVPEVPVEPEAVALEDQEPPGALGDLEEPAVLGEPEEPLVEARAPEEAPADQTA